MTKEHSVWDMGKASLYYHDGQLHREDGPAVEYKDGSVLEWWIHGYRHREDGPAVVKYYGSVQEWYIHGKRHREDGPAVEQSDGSYFEYYLNGMLHRLDGPAAYYGNPSSYKWYIDGEKFSDLYLWAKRALKELKQPCNRDDAAKYLQTVLAKTAEDEI